MCAGTSRVESSAAHQKQDRSMIQLLLRTWHPRYMPFEGFTLNPVLNIDLTFIFQRTASLQRTWILFLQDCSSDQNTGTLVFACSKKEHWTTYGCCVFSLKSWFLQYSIPFSPSKVHITQLRNQVHADPARLSNILPWSTLSLCHLY